LVVYHIQVDSNGNASVTRTPNDRNFVKGVDQVRFMSNDPDTVIRYRDTSPFAEPAVGPNKVLRIGTGQGPFKCMTSGNHHFDCGFINEVTGRFSLWGGTDGGDTSVGR
jgi:hypothetical protein